MKNLWALCASGWALPPVLATALARGWISIAQLERFPLCLFKLWTGIPCPGCGMGHALLLAWQGQWRRSFAAHPLGLPVLAAWSLWLVYLSMPAARRMRVAQAIAPVVRVFEYSGIVAFLVVYTLRLTHVLPS